MVAVGVSLAGCGGKSFPAITAALLAILFVFVPSEPSIAAQQPERGLNIQMRSGAALDGRGKTWAVVIGVSRYKNIPPGSQLKFAHRDAQDFADLLRSPAGGGFPSNQIQILLDQNATISAVRTALGTWLPRSAEPDDLVYVFFAGHGVLENEQEGYLLAHDSDPQNLYATALSIQEVDRVISERLKARQVVLIADACHAGKLGLTSRGGGNRALVARYLEEVGKAAPGVFKLLASRANEQSYEDQKWNGGHGVFSHFLLQGLRGRADKDNDGFVRAAELLLYLSETVPQATQALQHPQAAGNLDPQLPLAVVLEPARRTGPSPSDARASLEIRGVPGSEVYLDNSYRGRIRPNGLLVVDALNAGLHELSIDPPDAESFTQRISVGPGKLVIELERAAVRVEARSSPLVAEIRKAIARKSVLEPGGAWSLYEQLVRESPREPQRESVETLLTGALDGLGQQAINWYVHASVTQVEAGIFRKGAIALSHLKTLQGTNAALESRYLFCHGRALIVEERPQEAIEPLRRSASLDPRAAQTYNALGLAYERTGAPQDAFASFKRAAELAPNWMLPHLHIGILHYNLGRADLAEPELKIAAEIDPQYPLSRLVLARIARDKGRLGEAEKIATAVVASSPQYPPVYAELGVIYEAKGDFRRAVQAYDQFLLLLGDRPKMDGYTRDDVRQAAERLRRSTQAPSLKRRPF